MCRARRPIATTPMLTSNFMASVSTGLWLDKRTFAGSVELDVCSSEWDFLGLALRVGVGVKRRTTIGSVPNERSISSSIS